MPLAVGRVDQKDGVIARLDEEGQRRAGAGREEDTEIGGVGEVARAADAEIVVGILAPDVATRQNADPVGVGHEAGLDREDPEGGRERVVLGVDGRGDQRRGESGESELAEHPGLSPALGSLGGG